MRSLPSARTPVKYPPRRALAKCSMSDLKIPPALISTARVLAPAIAAGTAGSILTQSYFLVPVIRSIVTDLSTARGLDQLRAYFSSGSHIFPQLSGVGAALYALLAYVERIPAKRTGYSIAAAGTLGIAPFTILVMYPTVNKKLIEMHEKRLKAPAGAQAVEGESESERAEALLKNFEWQNAVRAGIMGAGAFAGLYTALVL